MEDANAGSPGHAFRSPVARRSLLLGAVGIALAGPIAAAPATRAVAGTAPTTIAGVIALARSYTGQGLAQIRATTDQPWRGFSDSDWCAWFVSWVIRGLGLGEKTFVEQMYAYGPTVSTPQPGDIVIFPGTHVGLVSQIVGGVPYTIDGNGGTQPPLATVVQERPVWSSDHVYVRPTYADSEAQNPGNPTDQITDEEQDMYIRRIATGEIAVFGSDYRAVTGGSVGRHIFASSTEYDAWRSVLTTYNAQIDAQGLDPRGKKFVPPAALTNVMGVDENGWAVVCSLYGV